MKQQRTLSDVTWLPKAPPHVKGIINLRGDVIPTIDLSCRQHSAALEPITLAGEMA